MCTEIIFNMVSSAWELLEILKMLCKQDLMTWHHFDDCVNFLHQNTTPTSCCSAHGWTGGWSLFEYLVTLFVLTNDVHKFVVLFFFPGVYFSWFLGVAHFYWLLINDCSAGSALWHTFTSVNGHQESNSSIRDLIVHTLDTGEGAVLWSCKLHTRTVSSP